MRIYWKNVFNFMKSVQSRNSKLPRKNINTVGITEHINSVLFDNNQSLENKTLINTMQLNYENILMCINYNSKSRRKILNFGERNGAHKIDNVIFYTFYSIVEIIMKYLYGTPN